jgi:hypothetical protein
MLTMRQRTVTAYRPNNKQVTASQEERDSDSCEPDSLHTYRG